MAGVVRNLMVRAGADFSPLESAMRRTSNEMSTFSSRIGEALSGIKEKLALIGVAFFSIEGLKEATQDAIELEATTANLNHILGQSSQAFIQWSQTVATTYGYSQLQAEKYGASFAHMISMFTTGGQQITQRTEALMKTAAIIANGTGRSIDDVMQRIQSGMLGNVAAINDLGIYANRSVLIMSTAFKQIANGRSWDKLSNAEQQQVIYMSLMEQAAKQYGETLQNNVHNKLVTFQATLNNVKVGLGNAFLPILDRVLPILTAFGQRLVTVTNIVTQFMETLFGIHHQNAKASDVATASTNKQTNAVNNLGTAVKNLGKAKKSAKGGLAGFDQIHTLTNSGSSGGGASSGSGGSAGGLGDLSGGLDGLNKAVQNLNDFSDAVNKTAEKVKAFFKGLSEGWKKIWSVIGPIVKFIVGIIWDDLKGAFDGIMQVAKGLSEFFSGIFSGNLGKAWQGIKDIFLGALKAIWNIVDLYFIAEIGGVFKSFLKIFPDLFRGGWKGMLKDALSGFKSIKDGIAGILDSIFEKSQSFIKLLISDMRQGFKDTWAAIKEPFVNTGDWFWNNVYLPIFTRAVEIEVKLTQKFKDIWNGIKSVFNDVRNWVTVHIVNTFINALDSAQGNIANAAQNIWDSIKAKFSGAYNWFRDNVVKEPLNAFNNWRGSIANSAGDVWSAIKSKFGGAYSWFKRYVADPISRAFSGISHSFSASISNGFKAIYNTAVGWLNGLIHDINKMVDKLNGLPLIHGIPHVPTIPKLANGGYVGANNPMLAMIGDNTQEGEIVAPESKIYQQTHRAIIDALGSTQRGSDKPIELTVNLGGTKIYKTIIDGINDTQRHAGKTLLRV